MIGGSLVLYTDWCRDNDCDTLDHDSYCEFIQGLELQAFEGDPSEYPGLHHAVCLMTAGRCRFEQLTIGEQDNIKWGLNVNYADKHRARLFDVGRTLHRGQWKITENVSDVQGHFNCGIHKVKGHDWLPDRILKVLPSESMYSGYARREIEVMYKLTCHPNIVQILDFHLPDTKNDAPWLVMDFCNAGTLRSCIEKNQRDDFEVPELFIWHVFESLLEAVRYCHHGPVGTDPALWDVISHRDIITGNILLRDEEGNINAYPTVKLADFGCAMPLLEVAANNLKSQDMPQEDPTAVPPEGPVASEAADVYQIGLVINDLMDREDGEDERHTNIPYTKELRVITDSCLIKCELRRPSAVQVLHMVRMKKWQLLRKRQLRYKKLLV